jgi:hypothetical protein
MLDENQTMLNTLLNWHRKHGPKAIPRQDMGYPDDVIDAFESSYSNEQAKVPVTLMAGAPGVMPDSSPYLRIDANALPLISGCLAGFDTLDLARIAASHGIDVEGFITSFGCTKPIQRLHPTSPMTGSEVFRHCFQALEMAYPEQIREIYNTLPGTDAFYMLAITTATSPQLWPKSRLTEYAKTNDGNPTAPAVSLSVEVHNFLGALKSEHQLPWDAAGPRYDWFLDRSGMLLPAVTNKSLGYFTLWEEMVYRASQPGDTPIHRLMDYCVDNPPESLRPGILNGFRSLSMQVPENANGSAPLLDFVNKKLKGSWLEPILTSDILKLNLLGLTRLSYDWKNRESLLQSVCNEILDTPTHNLGFAQFVALYLTRAIHGKHLLDQDFNRERFLVHLLDGMQCFIGSARSMSDGTEHIHKAVIKDCRGAIQQLSIDHQFDYAQFEGMPSSGIRLLIDEGLDKRRLPRMSNADRGRLLEDELGL